jgi:hypothetical protein
MKSEVHIPEPFLFNPLKHHLGYIRKYAESRSGQGYPGILNVNEPVTSVVAEIIRELKHLGTSVMDVYTGKLSVESICSELSEILELKTTGDRGSNDLLISLTNQDSRTTTLTDSSQWVIKYHKNDLRWAHFFPARYSPHTFRVKSNTLKSALFYNILIGKDYITGDDLNRIRPFLGLSPVRDSADTEAVTEMIEILRG